MDAASVVRSAPPVLELGPDPAATYQLDEGLIAIRADARPAAGATFKAEGLAVVPVASVSQEDEEHLIGPVYRTPGGGLGIVTGNVLVRFRTGDSAEAHSSELAAAGFQLEKVLPYAPQAAWVRPSDGGAVAALSHLDRLRAIPGAEHVEPQVITEAWPRG